MYKLTKKVGPMFRDMGANVPRKIHYHTINNFVHHHPDLVVKEGKYWCVRTDFALEKFRDWAAHYAVKYWDKNPVQPPVQTPVQASEPSVQEVMAQLKSNVEALRRAGYTVTCSVVAKPIEY